MFALEARFPDGGEPSTFPSNRMGTSAHPRARRTRQALSPVPQICALPRAAAPDAPAGPRILRRFEIGRGGRGAAGTLLTRRAPQHEVWRAGEYGSGERADGALCSRGRRRLRRAVPADVTSAVSILLASRDAAARGRRLLPGDLAEDASRARNLPRRFQCA